MTTIAYRDGYLAADTAVFDRGVYCGEVIKIIKLEDGSLCGAAGALGDMQKFLAWLRGGQNGDRPTFEDSETEGIVIRPDGTFWWYGKDTSAQIAGAHQAIGSGFALAMGAMDAGASALTALEICARRDMYTRAPITLLKLGA